MEAIQFTPQTNQINLIKLPIPVITHPREVLVKVAYSGVCGTDLHIIQGEFPCTPNPFILGHEFSATVVDFGKEVTFLTIGDRVIVDPNSGCHKCHFCHTGAPHHCSYGGFYRNLGVKNNGGWAEFCLCSMEQVYKLPEGVSLEVAALAEPLSCIAHGWDLVAPVPVGSEVLVTGAGIIGVLWVCLLHLHGHRKVTVVEVNPKRRQLLKGLMQLTNYRFKLLEEIQKEEKCFDVIIDCSGFGPAIEKGVSLLNSGGKFCIFGVAPPNTKIRLAPFDIYMKEMTILSVKVNPFSFCKASALVEVLADKYLDFDMLGIKTFGLSEFEDAIMALKSGIITKAIFRVL